MESALRIKKPHQGKNLHPRRRHQGKQSVSRGRRWGKSNRSYDGTSGVPEFKNGALTGAFSRLFNDVAAHRQTGLNTGDDISSKKAVLNIRNERDETITLNAGELTVNVQAGETAGPFEVNAGETGLHITSDSGSQFGANSFSIRESYRYDVIVFGTDYVSRVFSNSIVDFSVSQGLNFNGSQNFFIRGVNLRPLKTEVRIGGSRGIKVFDGQCGLIGC